MLMKMRSKMQNQKGFTLVELMVVVVILGILVAIAVPIYNNASTNAKQKSHDSNVRILQGAATSYYATVGSLDEAETWNGTEDQNWKGFIDEWPADPFAREGGYSVTIATDGKVTVTPASGSYGS